MKAAFQDSASAFPSSQLITLMKQFTNKCEFDKSSSAPVPHGSRLYHPQAKSELSVCAHVKCANPSMY